MSDSKKLLMQFVISDGRVYPKRWGQLHRELLRHDASVPPPLILGGAITSDLAKRIRLLEQILAVKDDPEAFDSAERFLRGEPLSAWKCAPEPLSNTDSYDYQDVSRTHADSFIQVHTARSPFGSAGVCRRLFPKKMRNQVTGLPVPLLRLSLSFPQEQ